MDIVYNTAIKQMFETDSGKYSRQEVVKMTKANSISRHIAIIVALSAAFFFLAGF